MLQNYLKTAIRSLLRHRFFSAINIFGLAVAMSICMVLIMLVADQMSYDRHNTNAHRIYRVTTNGVDANGNDVGDYNSCVNMKVMPELLEKYTGVEKAARLKRGFGNGWIQFENQDVNVPLAGFYADPEVFEIFQYEFQYGDPATALKEPYSVVLTRKAANKLFKDENPLGQIIKVGKLGNFTVTGVLKETTNKSHIAFEGLASMATVKSLLTAEQYKNEMEDWFANWDGWTYIMVDQGKTQADIQAHLDKIFQEHISNQNSAIYGDYRMMYGLQPLLSITPGDIMNNAIGPVLPWVFVYFLGGLALVILLTSCFNFTNLSIARSLTRAREIGVRKVNGAARWQIFAQFISESIVVAFVALLLAIGFLIVLKPMLLRLNFAQIFHWDLYNGFSVYIIFVVFAIVVGVFAGFFPAVVLSGFEPVKVLKSLNNLRLFSRMGLRKVLLVSQFTLSLFFILTVMVMYSQLQLFVTKDHGFNTKNNIMVKLNNTSYQNLKTELQKYGNITSVSAASHVPAAGTSNSNEFKKYLTDPEAYAVGIFQVDEDYLSNMQLTPKAGEFFTAERGATNKNYIVVNEATLEKFQLGTPMEAIGQQLIRTYDSSALTILGVVPNYNHRDLTREITPAALMYNPESWSVAQVSFMGPYDQASQSIERAWATVNPGLKVDYKSVESEINLFYEIVFGDLVRVLGFVSFLAIFISCLGLLGMATYTTETRLKEISIRKVLGSSSGALVLLLSKSFLKMLGLAIVIGVPLAYFVNGLWLNFIAYRTTIGFTTIAISVLILILFGALTIGSQTIRATFVRPVENLKSE